MKQYMSISGMEQVDNNTMELTLVPLTAYVKKQKVGLMQLASGDMESLISMIPQKQNKTKMYISLEQWGMLKLVIGKHIVIDLYVDDADGVTI